MASNNKRREATRRQLEQQLRDRQQREARRKRAVLIGSVSGSAVVIVLIIVLVIVISSGGSTKKPQAGGNTTKPPATTSAAPSTSSIPTDTPCKVTHPAGSVLFDNVTIANPTNLAKSPAATSCSKTPPKAFAYKDLVVGKGKAATTTSQVSVQYYGILYSDGYQFNSTWRDTNGKPYPFTLPSGAIPGFAEGISGKGAVPPMRVGGRRVMILPASLAYGTAGQGNIPPNTPLVFVVDLKSVK